MYILGQFGDCTKNNLCEEDEGDCDNDDQCKENHKCGTDNCRSMLSLHSQFDCCYNEDEDLCTIHNPCGDKEGDCDSDDMCQEGLLCGLNNCPASLGFDSDVDCCYLSIVGMDDFCTADNPCGVDEGDCDSNNECQTSLICDTANSCPANLGFTSDVNCCFAGCKSHQIILNDFNVL